MGATVAAIPCNTAHAPAIFDVIRAGVAGFERPLRLLHLIDETADHLAAHYPDLRTIGVLSTTGTWRAQLSVSYTHLDVYKRQELDRGPEMLGAWN